LVLAPRRSDADLSRALDRFIESADPVALVSADPVALVRPYLDPHDREVAGFFVAMMAYGRVAQIKAKASRLLEMLGPHPKDEVDRGSLRSVRGFVHRFQGGDDFYRFARAVRSVRNEYGSLALAFAAGTKTEEPDYSRAMGRFIALLTSRVKGELSHGLRFLLPQPDSGGAAKRLCLYLRWMVRPAGAIDLGAWQALATGLSPAKLIIPLDTHIERIGRYLGLTDRKTSGLKTAIEITESLRRLRPDDPLAYDIALCHLGISGRCPKKRDIAACAECPINAVCRLGEEPKRWPYRLRSR
jgi:uncharacterized protein (TIGR02757 family)